MASSTTNDGEYDLEVTRDRAEVESVSLAVADAVAALEDVEPTDLEPIFYAVDPEALDALFEPDPGDAGSASRRVTFTYHDHEVTVAGGSDRTITITIR